MKPSMHTASTPHQSQTSPKSSFPASAPAPSPDPRNSTLQRPPQFHSRLKARTPSSATPTAPFKPLSTPRNSTARPTDLTSRVEQLKTSVERTHGQVLETLEQFEAVRRGREKGTAKREEQAQTDVNTNSAVTDGPVYLPPQPRLPSTTTMMSVSTTTFTPSQQATLSEAQKTLDRHIRLLREYNELKDAGMMMLGIIAEKEGRRVVDVMEERGIADGE